MSGHRVSDDGDPRKYWTQLPNIVFTIGLSSQELSLYAHLKRAAGETGKCFKSTRTLARETGMGVGTISRAKASLETKMLGAKPLIRTTSRPNSKGGKPYDEITVSDIWPENMAAFASSPSKELVAQDQVPLGAEQVPIGNVASSTLEHKKNIREEEPIKKGEPPHPAILMIQEITGKYPKKVLWPDLVKVLGDFPARAKLERCFKAWILRDYNPMNFSWITEWYVKGIPIGGNGRPTQAEMNRGGTGNLVI